MKINCLAFIFLTVFLLSYRASSLDNTILESSILSTTSYISSQSVSYLRICCLDLRHFNVVIVRTTDKIILDFLYALIFIFCFFCNVNSFCKKLNSFPIKANLVHSLIHDRFLDRQQNLEMIYFPFGVLCKDLRDALVCQTVVIPFYVQGKRCPYLDIFFSYAYFSIRPIYRIFFFHNLSSSKTFRPYVPFLLVA